jgi:hypothetical protein
MTPSPPQTAASPAASKLSSMRSHVTPLRRPSRRRLVFFPLCAVLVWPARAQSSDPNALRWVRAAVASQLYSDGHDIAWMYRDHDIQPGHDTLTEVVDTPHDGGVRRTLVLNGKTLTGEAFQGETDRINAFVASPDAQAHDRKNSAHDDTQSTALLKMWPDAFIWSTRSETPEFVTLDYRPNPAFDPPTIEARVMGQMQGDMVITRTGDHIYSLRGRLMQDIHIAFGLVKLKAGGTFDVERREVAPGHWQIVEQHTHIDGHALLFKTISEQEDEWKSDLKPSPAANLEEAARILDTAH